MRKVAQACTAAGCAAVAVLAAFALWAALFPRVDWPEPLTRNARHVVFVDAFTQLAILATAVCAAAYVVARLAAAGGHSQR